MGVLGAPGSKAEIYSQGEKGKSRALSKASLLSFLWPDWTQLWLVYCLPQAASADRLRGVSFDDTLAAASISQCGPVRPQPQEDQRSPELSMAQSCMQQPLGLGASRLYMHECTYSRLWHHTAIGLRTCYAYCAPVLAHVLMVPILWASAIVLMCRHVTP